MIQISILKIEKKLLSVYPLENDDSTHIGNVQAKKSIFRTNFCFPKTGQKMASAVREVCTTRDHNAVIFDGFQEGGRSIWAPWCWDTLHTASRTTVRLNCNIFISNMFCNCDPELRLLLLIVGVSLDWTKFSALETLSYNLKFWNMICIALFLVSSKRFYEISFVIAPENSGVCCESFRKFCFCVCFYFTVLSTDQAQTRYILYTTPHSEP